MKKPVVFRDEATQEISETVFWYEEQKTNLGVRFIQLLDSTLERISCFPESYPIIYRQARMAPMQQFPYLVIYCVYENFISVIAVMHGKRHSSRWQSRFKK